MSISIDKYTLSQEEKKQISTDLFSTSDTVLYDVAGRNVTVPMAYGYSKLLHNFELKSPLDFERNFSSKLHSNFEHFELRPNQIEVFENLMNQLARTKTAILSLPTGFGKTALAIAAAAAINEKTLTLSPRTTIAGQWKESIDKFLPDVGCQIVTDINKIDPNMMVYIVSPRIFKARAFDFIKFLIIDELHLVLTKSMAVKLKSIFPRYFLGISATPYRNDEANAFIELFLGRDQITLDIKRKHYVYKIDYRVDYEIKRGYKNKLDWTFVLKQQSENAGRNSLIVDIIKKNAGRIFIILCKRKQQIFLLNELLARENIDSYIYTGASKKYENNSNVLLTTISKSGVGFNDPRLNAMIIASDVENYFIQCIGRIFRADKLTTIPLVFDIVDSNFVMKKHWETRRADYINAGGEIFENSLLFDSEK